MNCIIIVGHPSSGYQEVEKILQQRGMTPPIPSQREELLPKDITANLCKFYQTPNIASVTTEEEIKPLQVAPVWQGMALELMLGNLDQKFWGWSDPESIYSLDYWKQLDDGITFMLVYDTPQQALLNAVIDHNNLSSSTIEHNIKNWMAYNAALLAFFLRNRNRCVLVNTQQVKRNINAFFQELDVTSNTQPFLFGENKSEELNHSIINTEESRLDLALNSILSPIKIKEIANLAGMDAKATHDAITGNTVENYLLSQLVNDYPSCKIIYSELQSVANIPFKANYKEVLDPSMALEKIIQQRMKSKELAVRMYQAYLDMGKSLEASVKKTKKENLILSELQQSKDLIENKYLQKSEKIKILQHENRLLLNQLHYIQEKLEHYFIENSELKQQQFPIFYGAAERVKQELAYRLGATMIIRSRSLTGWLGMPQALAAERRAWHEENNTQSHNNLPPISIYRDAYEAARVKNHLSYRLGQVLTRDKFFLIGWVKLPFSLIREVNQFRRQRYGS